MMSIKHEKRMMKSGTQNKITYFPLVHCLNSNCDAGRGHEREVDDAKRLPIICSRSEDKKE